MYQEDSQHIQFSSQLQRGQGGDLGFIGWRGAKTQAGDSRDWDTGVQRSPNNHPAAANNVVGVLWALFLAPPYVSILMLMSSFVPLLTSMIYCLFL